MFSCLRFLAIVVFGLLTVVFGIMGLISSFMYTRYGSITMKTIRVSGIYLALTFVSATLAVIVFDPAKASAAIVFLAMGLFFVAFYVIASHFNVVLLARGPRKMFAPAWQFLKRLFTWHNSD